MARTRSDYTTHSHNSKVYSAGFFTSLHLPSSEIQIPASLLSEGPVMASFTPAGGVSGCGDGLGVGRWARLGISPMSVSDLECVMVSLGVI